MFRFGTVESQPRVHAGEQIVALGQSSGGVNDWPQMQHGRGVIGDGRKEVWGRAS